MYRKLYIIIIFTAVVLVCGCTDISQFVPVENYNSKVLELEEANSETESKSLEIVELKEEVNNLKNDLELSNEEIEKYNNLICNLNELLSNVYYVYESKNDGSSVWGTGFSLEYKDKIYLISAGHAIENKYGVFKNLGFKANFNDNWIYPELLIYEITDTAPDYAIFYSDKIKTGLNYDLKNSEPDYRLGINKLIQENNNWGIDGECGSPIIDLDGEVIGIHVGYISDIDNVIEAIDNAD